MKPDRWDLYLQFTQHFSWTPQQVDRLDPDYVTELLLFWRAEQDAQRVKGFDHGEE